MAGRFLAEPRSATAQLLAGLGLVALALLVYLPAFEAGLIWDDEKFVFANPIIQAPSGLYTIWFTTTLSDYFPVTASLFWLEWRLWGDDPSGYHAVNLLLHALVALVAWRVLRRLAVPGALLAAALFAVHPVGVEVAAWISETKTTLSLLLAGLAVLAHLRFEERDSAAWYATSLGLFLLAALAKTSVVMLPCLLLVLAWWRRGRIQVRDLQGLLPHFALALALGLLTVRQEAIHVLEPGDPRPEGLASRLAATGWAVWFYAFKLVAPLRLSAIYPRWDVDPGWPLSWAPLVGLLALAGLAWRARSGWGRPVLVGLGCYVLMLAPVLGLVPFKFHHYSLVADHLQYPAMLAPLALLAAALERGLATRLPRRWQQLALLLAILAPLAWLSHQRARVFHDHETLWTDTLQKNPGSWAAHYNLGVVLTRAGRDQDAMHHFRSALEIDSQRAEVHDALGQALRRQGRRDAAIEHYRRGLEIAPSRAALHNNLANALRDTGQLDEAIRHYRRALELAPWLETARLNLEQALREQEARDR